MEMEFFVVFIAIFMAGIAFGRWTVGSTRTVDVDLSGLPRRKEREQKTPVRTGSCKAVLSARPVLPPLRKTNKKTWLWARLQKEVDVAGEDLSDEDRALVLSLIRSGQDDMAKRVFRQTTRLKEPALSNQFAGMLLKFGARRSF